MKFGIQHPSFTFDGDGPTIVDSLRKVAIKAEDLGYDSFWVMDHLHQIQMVGPPQEPMLESWATISALAGSTSRIKLGTLCTGNAYRHPSVLAKMGATVDVLSKGRLFLGIGAAWDEEEALAYGIPFPSTKERLERLDEAVQVIRLMWTEDRASFDGRYYQLRGAYCNPKPIQKPHPKILIGGSGERRTLKTVAKYGDACNIFGSVDTVKGKLEVLRGHCKEVGRDYDSIIKSKLGRVIVGDRESIEKGFEQMGGGVTKERMKEFLTYGTPEQIRQDVEAYREAGIDYLIFSFDPRHELEAVTRFGSDVVSTF
ncbi:MAG TPA: LLM class F420-dependent oxidoreductase [Nitrososphaerales archaeon]|nr:LLM class F420-dependent oxidoreductase [Nitrososphaerales archaeon]